MRTPMVQDGRHNNGSDDEEKKIYIRYPNLVILILDTAFDRVPLFLTSEKQKH